MPRCFTLRFPAPVATAAWDPSQLPGVVAWCDGSDTASIASSGSPAQVTQINDKTGLGNHFTASAGTGPKTGVATINGLNVLTYDTSTRHLDNTSLGTISAPFTLFMVVKFTAWGNWGLSLGSESGAADFNGFVNQNTIIGLRDSAGRVQSSTAALNTLMSMMGMVNGASSKLATNGTVDTGSTGTASGGPNWHMGTTFGGNVGIAGVVCEWAVCTGDQSASLSNWQTYVARWGL